MANSTAVDEIMEEFGVSETEAQAIAEAEDLGLILDADGTILDVDPDEPIDLVPATDDEMARWN
jgi:hypothetical protein